MKGRHTLIHPLGTIIVDHASRTMTLVRHDGTEQQLEATDLGVNMSENPILAFNQKIRAAMRQHGLTEVFESVYSAGDFDGKKLAAVHVDVKPSASDAEITAACDLAAKTYREIVRGKP